jgi:hypothetical protein
VGIHEFRDDDRGYLSWVGANRDGFVINMRRNFNPIDARTHHASCRTITGENARGGPWTGLYIKLCSVDVGELDEWAIEHAGEPITRCRVCHPGWQLSDRGTVPSTSQSKTAAARPRAESVPERPAELRGPSVDLLSVAAWADDYIRFERRTVWQEELRRELRARLRRLDATAGQVLHATFFGRKHHAADVENLVLYNIDDTGASFADAARYGLRFELGERCPTSPTGRRYAYGYRYELMSRSAGFQNWREGRELASWGWIDLGAFAGAKKLEQVWLALVRAGLHGASSCRSPDTPFAVLATIRPPRATTPKLGYLIKGVIDGVVCAFQAHTDVSTVTELAARVSKNVGAPAAEIEAHLMRQETAVLGSAPRLLHARSQGVIWAPADDLCVAGELLTERPIDSAWALKGKIVELGTEVRSR